MSVEVKFIKELPKVQIQKFENRVVYNAAVLTREATKVMQAYPHLSGELERQEIAAPIEGNNKEYSLLSGPDYAKYVWKMTNVKWTNTSTVPQWYFNVFKKKKNTIVSNAVIRALKEI